MLPSKIVEPLNRQLECIRLCVEEATRNRIDDESTSTNVSVETINSKFILVRQDNFTAEITPVYPGSILHNDVSVVLKTDGIVSNSTHESKCHSVRAMAYIPADAHYARFHPAFQPLTKNFYKQPQPRITFFTENAPVLEKKAIAALQNYSLSLYPASSFGKLQVNWCPLAATTVVPTPKPSHHKQIRNVGDKGNTEQAVAHEIIAADAIPDRAALINKSDIVITDNTGIAMDAVSSSVPVGFSSTPSEFVDIQYSFDRFLLHTDRSVAAHEQRLALTKLIENLHHYAYVTDSEQVLHALLVDHLQLPRCLKPSNSTSLEHSPIVKPHTHAPTEPAHIYTFDTHLTNGRRKWRKFRESPKRFLHDSQHWALKPVKSFAR